ncbi:MAG: MFS transporter [Nocardiaceae bacterium]|nr:MFS transporter [Nocardiaceae bacterium]
MSRPQTPVHPKSIIAAISLALFCIQIDYFAMNLALPRMADDLSSSSTDLQWVISAYMLALGAFMVPGGRVGDIYGRRRVLLIGIGLFGLASILCALAPNVGFLVAFRVVQGLGAALVFPVSVSVLTNAFPAGEAGKTIGLCYGIAGLGNAAGPLVGGFLTAELSWRWIFWLNVPLTLVALAIVAVRVVESTDATASKRIDIAGLALITTGIGLFTLVFDRATSWGWVSVQTLGLFGAAVFLLAAFVVVENRIEQPLVDLSLLRQSRFTILVVAGAVANISYAVTVFGSTLALQQGRGMGPLEAGLVFLGPSIGAALGGPVSGRLGARIPHMIVMGGDCIVAAVAEFVLGSVHALPAYVAALTATGFTLGLIYAFTTVATQSVVSPARAGEAAGVTLTVIVTLAGVGIAVASTVIEMLESQGSSLETAVGRILQVLALGLLLAGAAVLAASRSRR